MNVTELARQIKMPKELMLAKARSLGFDIGDRAIKIDDRVAEQVKQAIAQAKKAEKRQKMIDAAAAKREAKEDTGTDDGEEKKEVALPEFIIVREFADRLGKPVNKVIMELMNNGIMANLNEEIDFDTATIIAEELGYTVTKDSESGDDENKEKKKGVFDILSEDKEQQERPPVIVVMGHVDHGKTKLLDTIRQTNIVEQEAGAITQHIGAYQVRRKEKLLTFIDTPGHQAFTAMRSRGARVADVAIIVIAADDGIQPQTLEAIEIAQKEDIPFIIALNKIDLETADVDRIKTQLAELNLTPEDWGGKTVTVPVSAEKNKGVDELLDMLLLVAEVAEPKAKKNRPAVGTVVESHISPNQGPVATILVQAGMLKIGDWFMIGTVGGKIKAMKDWQGKLLKEAGPSTPVQVMGLPVEVSVGALFQVIDKETAKKLRRKGGTKRSAKRDAYTDVRNTLHHAQQKIDVNIKELPIIVKADVLGSVEALMNLMQDVAHPEVKTNIVHYGLGDVTEKDVQMAKETGAIIYAFNVDAMSGAEDLARGEEVEIKSYNVIYHLLDDIKKEMSALLDPEIEEKELGTLELLKIFNKKGNMYIAGGQVKDGKVVNQHPMRVERDEQEVGRVQLKQLQKDKQDAKEVSKGVECGMKIEASFPGWGSVEIQEGDMLVCYEEVKKERNIE